MIRLIIYQHIYLYRDDHYDKLYEENWLVFVVQVELYQQISIVECPPRWDYMQNNVCVVQNNDPAKVVQNNPRGKLIEIKCLCSAKQWSCKGSSCTSALQKYATDLGPIGNNDLRPPTSLLTS